jgi:hypothetical protein
MPSFVGPDEPVDQPLTTTSGSMGFVGPDSPVSLDSINDDATKGFDFERSPNYPTAAMTDATPGDLLAAQGVAGIGKAGIGALAGTAESEGGGVLDTLGQYAKRFGQNQAMKTIGARGGQIGQVGIPESRAIAQKLIDQDVISPLRGPIGLEEKVEQLHDAAGQGIGSARAAGNKIGQAPSMAEILQQVNQDLTPKYSSGVDRGMAALNRAKEEIAKGGTGDFVGNAQKATDLNASAAANKIYRPQGANTDVADIISRLNNDKLAQTLSPEEMAKYNANMKDYGDYSKVKEFIKSGERKEMTGRGGAATVGKALTDKTMDMLGNRVAATGASHLGDILQSPALNGFVDSSAPRMKNLLAAYLLNQNQDQ